MPVINAFFISFYPSKIKLSLLKREERVFEILGCDIVKRVTLYLLHYETRISITRITWFPNNALLKRAQNFSHTIVNSVLA